jgi:raffinose/stachyose/melibiose transport system substrate-binding protein
MKRGFMVLAAAFSLAAVTGLFAAGQKEGGAPAQGMVNKGPREKIVWLQWANEPNQKAVDAVVKAFGEKYPIDIEFEFKPGSAEGENLVKTRLAANDMPDLLSYNSGALFQVINPDKNLVDLSKEPLADKLLDSFKNVVGSSQAFYGVPLHPIQVGGILYNKKVYASLGLSIPKTWNEFMANCEKIKKAGKVPVIASYKDDWTAQLLLLADYYYVQASYPNFASDYTANKAKFATNPAALRGFEKIQEVYTKGYINKEPMSTTYDMAQKMLAYGEGVHYPMATWVLASINEKFPDKVNDIGFFALPGDSADKNGVTLWMPNNISIPKVSKHIEAAKKFLNFFVSPEGIAAYMSAGTPDGSFAIKDVKLPDDVFPAIKDVLVYINANKTAPALEFLSPIKGPNLPQICVEAGMGLKSPAECAAEYDRDVEKQAKQLMLPGW